MYLEYFGLSKPPFRITPDTHVFFEGSDRGPTLNALVYAIHNDEGIIKVVGEVGTGKTMLCRMLPTKIEGDIDWVYIAHPRLSPDQVLQEVARELHLSLSDYPDKLIVMRKLQAALLEKYANNRRVVVLVEEAQEMPLETLEELRLLSNLETDEHKLLQIVLFGQPELDEKLAARKIRQLRERITHSLYLQPLPLPDIHAYLNFRIRASGYRGPDLFSLKVATAIEKYSHGLIRRINILADKALLTAYARNSYEIRVKDIQLAASDSQYEPKRRRWPWREAIASFILLANVQAIETLDLAAVTHTTNHVFPNTYLVAGTKT